MKETITIRKTQFKTDALYDFSVVPGERFRPALDTWLYSSDKKAIRAARKINNEFNYIIETTS